MIRISRKTRLRREDIIERASQFFGRGGEGLDEVERGDCCISFQGAGGHVSIWISEEGGQRFVEIESREFEHPAKRFLESV